ncbi:hypothetical protein V8F20_011889 [Naviculisporaceae sp. PSN 640]
MLLQQLLLSSASILLAIGASTVHLPTVAAAAAVVNYKTKCGPNFEGKCCKIVNPSYSGVYLACDCQNDAGIWRSTTLELGHCFVNRDGYMSPEPEGQFARSCEQMVYNYKENRLHARCRRSNNNFWDISVDIADVITVDNGWLKCYGISDWSGRPDNPLHNFTACAECKSEWDVGKAYCF